MKGTWEEIALGVLRGKYRHASVEEMRVLLRGLGLGVVVEVGERGKLFRAALKHLRRKGL